MALIQTLHSNCIALYAGKQGLRSLEVGALAPVFEESVTESKPNLLRCRNIVNTATFNIRHLNTENQLQSNTKKTIKYAQEHRYYHWELELKYYDTGNGWTLITSSAWENLVNTAVGGVGMLLSPRDLKSLNCIERTQPRIMCATFNGNHCTTIVSCYSPTNASDESEWWSKYYLPMVFPKKFLLRSWCFTKTGK